MKRRNTLTAALSAVLAAALLAVASGCGDGMTSGGKFETYDDAAYSVGSGAVPTFDSYQIDVEWVAGEILITADPMATQVSITEDYAGGDACALRYRTEEGLLEVKYAASGADISSLEGKTLSIVVPTAGVSGFEIETESAGVKIFSVTGAVLKAETVSGEISVSDFRFGRGDFQTSSGNVTLSFAPSAGFRLTYDTDHGRLHDGLGMRAMGGVYSYGNEDIHLEVETSTGDLTLQSY